MPVQSSLTTTEPIPMLSNLSPTNLSPTPTAAQLMDEGDNSTSKREFAITTSLKLYVSSKSKQKKKIWVQVTSNNDFTVNVVPGETTYEEFKDLVAAACDLEVPNTGDIVAENKPNLIWNVTLSRVKGWLKGDGKTLTDDESFDNWMAAILACSKKKDIPMTLALRMTNPADVVKRGKQADILAKRAKLKKAIELKRSAKRKAGDDDVEEMSEDEDNEIDPEDWNDVDFHMRALFDANPINLEYDAHCPVFLHPTVSGRFILLTMEACQEWAIGIMDEKSPGVNMMSPPKSLTWEDLGSPKKKQKTAASSTPIGEDKATWCRMMVEAFVEVGKARASPNDAAPGSDGIPYQPDSETQIIDYLRFLNIRNLDSVHNILASNDILSHKMFRPGSSLSRQEVLSLGLTFGVVTALYDNASKFDRFLSNAA
ncbi:hypothetical protein PGT21_050185 [Puccinia graminis f. sp. tritici]|uniref:Uncharacterized protein n=1 Tax=Puccinia graminis f. sp. tritici TaxID=56615 RepID=A0A5B0QUG9_PUCGR|nr:hypothetical protein PGT21_050185 [Puccinia graminis f. sp. tritici]KAA1116947.1 hypothetical protein PGTUg99_031809 [Puccinia graminis f. sp. tritici]